MSLPSSACLFDPRFARSVNAPYQSDKGLTPEAIDDQCG